jgi:hypothetical protein
MRMMRVREGEGEDGVKTVVRGVMKRWSSSLEESEAHVVVEAREAPPGKPWRTQRLLGVVRYDGDAYEVLESRVDMETMVRTIVSWDAQERRDRQERQEEREEEEDEDLASRWRRASWEDGTCVVRYERGARRGRGCRIPFRKGKSPYFWVDAEVPKVAYEMPSKDEGVAWLFCVTERRPGVSSEGFLGGPSHVVEACVHAGDEEGKPPEASWMRTELSAVRGSDGTLTVTFWPPVVRWMEQERCRDSSLMVRTYETASRGTSLLLRAFTYDREHGVRVGRLGSRGSADVLEEWPCVHTIGGDVVIVAVSSAIVRPALVGADPKEVDEVERMVRKVATLRDRAARRIGRAWRRSMSSPEHVLCRERLRREWEEMGEL